MFHCRKEVQVYLQNLLQTSMPIEIDPGITRSWINPKNDRHQPYE